MFLGRLTHVTNSVLSDLITEHNDDSDLASILLFFFFGNSQAGSVQVLILFVSLLAVEFRWKCIHVCGLGLLEFLLIFSWDDHIRVFFSGRQNFCRDFISRKKRKNTENNTTCWSHQASTIRFELLPHLLMESWAMIWPLHSFQTTCLHPQSCTVNTHGCRGFVTLHSLYRVHQAIFKMSVNVYMYCFSINLFLNRYRNSMQTSPLHFISRWDEESQVSDRRWRLIQRPWKSHPSIDSGMSASVRNWNNNGRARGRRYPDQGAIYKILYPKQGFI